MSDDKEVIKYNFSGTVNAVSLGVVAQNVYAVDSKAMEPYTIAASTMHHDVIFHAKDGGETLRLTDEGFIYKGETIADAGLARATMMRTLGYSDDMPVAPSEAAVEALTIIRKAGNNVTTWDEWAQNMAAWGLEPGKVSKPSVTPPPFWPGESLTIASMIAAHLRTTTVLDSGTASRVTVEILKMIIQGAK
jgi:hypothetical protein